MIAMASFQIQFLLQFTGNKGYFKLKHMPRETKHNVGFQKSSILEKQQSFKCYEIYFMPEKQRV